MANKIRMAITTGYTSRNCGRKWPHWCDHKFGFLLVSRILLTPQKNNNNWLPTISDCLRLSRPHNINRKLLSSSKIVPTRKLRQGKVTSWSSLCEQNYKIFINMFFAIHSPLTGYWVSLQIMVWFKTFTAAKQCTANACNIHAWSLNSRSFLNTTDETIKLSVHSTDVITGGSLFAFIF